MPPKNSDTTFVPSPAPGRLLMPEAWTAVDDALAAAEQKGRSVVVWMRDDDAITVTPALDRLTALARTHAMPVLLAVIPARADTSLAAYTAAEPLLQPTQHGYAHVNHAAAGARACEIGGARPLNAVIDDVARGRDAMQTLFGSRSADIMVPPWNRIAPDVLPRLPELGFGALSTFADAHHDSAALDVINSTLDIIDWRGGRRCHPEEKLVSRLAAAIDEGRPIGLLSHHLVHDEDAWRFLNTAIGRLRRSPAVSIVAVDALRNRRHS